MLHLTEYNSHSEYKLTVVIDRCCNEFSSVEHLTVNQGVTGSSPVGGARKKHLRKQVLFSTKSADGGINPPSVDEIRLRRDK